MQNKNGHHPESRSSRADKMSGAEGYVNKSSKKFFNRKKRMLLKNPDNYNKI